MAVTAKSDRAEMMNFTGSPPFDVDGTAIMHAADRAVNRRKALDTQAYNPLYGYTIDGGST